MPNIISYVQYTYVRPKQTMRNITYYVQQAMYHNAHYNIMHYALSIVHVQYSIRCITHHVQYYVLCTKY